jgi:hypothetical protein
MKQTDPGGSDTLHLTTAWAYANNAPNILLMYDRLWHGGSVSHTINTAQTISGTPTRYTTTESVGNFMFDEVTTAIGATAQNLTATYVDDAGSAAEAAAAVAMTASSVATRIPHPQWFIPLNAGDKGLRNITQVQFSAANTAGASAMVIGHAIQWFPITSAFVPSIMDGINSAFNLVQIKTGACLAFLEIKGQGAVTTYTGQMIAVSG